MRLQIYFAGSIRGTAPDRDTYGALIDELTRHGTVLTEHVRLEQDQHDRLPDSEIHARQMRWLRAADVVVAEVTAPSLGVGYEIAWAEASDKPVLCLYKPSSDRSLSAMIDGSPNVTVVRYESADEAIDAVRGFLSAAMT
jgi:2'-deoxynucleoside 5'-phosphate N-hydrolase